MKNIVVFRPKGDDAVWVADLEAETLERMDAVSMSSAGIVTDFISVAERAREGEMSIVKGMDFAIAASALSTAASHELYKRPVG